MLLCRYPPELVLAGPSSWQHLSLPLEDHMENPLGQGGRAQHFWGSFSLSCLKEGYGPGCLTASLRAFLASQLWLLLPWCGEGQVWVPDSQPSGRSPCVCA